MQRIDCLPNINPPRGAHYRVRPVVRLRARTAQDAKRALVAALLRASVDEASAVFARIVESDVLLGLEHIRIVARPLPEVGANHDKLMLNDSARTDELHGDGIDGYDQLLRKCGGILVLKAPHAVNLSVRRRERTASRRVGATNDHKDAVRGHILQVRLRPGQVHRAEGRDRIRVDYARLRRSIEEPKLPTGEIRLRRHRHFHILPRVVAVAPQIVVATEHIDLVDPRPARRYRIENVIRREAASGVVVDRAVPRRALAVIPVRGS